MKISIKQLKQLIKEEIDRNLLKENPQLNPYNIGFNQIKPGLGADRQPEQARRAYNAIRVQAQQALNFLVAELGPEINNVDAPTLSRSRRQVEAVENFAEFLENVIRLRRTGAYGFGAMSGSTDVVPILGELQRVLRAFAAESAGDSRRAFTYLLEIGELVLQTRYLYRALGLEREFNRAARNFRPLPGVTRRSPWMGRGTVEYGESDDYR